MFHSISGTNRKESAGNATYNTQALTLLCAPVGNIFDFDIAMPAEIQRRINTKLIISPVFIGGKGSVFAGKSFKNLNPLLESITFAGDILKK